MSDTGFSENANTSVSRRAVLRFGGLALAGAAAPVVWSRTAQASTAAPADVVHVDLTRLIGRPTYRATGFLHGLSEDGARPPDQLLRPLKPRLFRGSGSTLPGRGWGGGGYDGYAVRWASTVTMFDRVASGPLNAEYCIVMSDLWGAEGVSLKPTDPYPGDGGDWSSYEAFVRQVVADVKAAGMRPEQLRYEIWNEPDFQEVYFPRPKEQYEELWRRGVRLIRQLDPEARISGPTFTRITVTEPVWQMDDWLDMAVASDTAPDILSWHDLIPGRDPVTQAGLARSLLSERGLSGVQLEINEYPANTGLDPGFNAWYVARLERAGIDYGVLAIFGQCCMYPQLDGLLTQEGDDLFTTGRWWIYQRYGSLSGELASVRQGGVADAVAGLDRTERRARIVLGNRRGDGSDLGTVRVTVDGVSPSDLGSRGRIPVRLERIPDRAELDRPEVVLDLDVVPDGSRLQVDIPWYDADSAYVITLGSQDHELPPLVIVDADPAAPVLLHDRPTPITFRLRNYTDAELTVLPRASVTAGYTVQSPAQVTVPANADATTTLTVTRTTTTLADGELRLSAGDQVLAVPLTASDNWLRIAAMSASSTHAPSAAANLNDGRTDPELWGGGGAGGWNDNTERVFPDSVFASWAEPVPLARVRVHTLDSRAYPAAQWGVRDYDVLVRVDGSWRTVAQVRGNLAGVVESRFEPVAADRLEVRVLDSNSHDYSRLLEIEGFGS